MLNSAIIGFGFVGKAINRAFTNDISTTIIDPKLGTSLDHLPNDADVVFIAVPTPMGEDGKIDASIVTTSVKYAIESTNAIICIKSTVTPDVIKELSDLSDRVVYNPEFLRERSADEDFVNPNFHIFGGSVKSCDMLRHIYINHSACNMNVPIYRVEAVEASFVKYGINTFLASKVLWFNQFYDVVKNFDASIDPSSIIEVVAHDDRVGSSHTVVPGPDGRRGYGGACFPKDTSAFLNFDSSFSVLGEVIRSNSEYRLRYDLDDRETEQKVKYRQ